MLTVSPTTVVALRVVCAVAKKRLTTTRAPRLPKREPPALTSTRSKTSLALALIVTVAGFVESVRPLTFAPAAVTFEEPSTVLTTTVAAIDPNLEPAAAILMPEFSVCRSDVTETVSLALISDFPKAVKTSLSAKLTATLRATAPTRAPLPVIASAL